MRVKSSELSTRLPVRIFQRLIFASAQINLSTSCSLDISKLKMPTACPVLAAWRAKSRASEVLPTDGRPKQSSLIFACRIKNYPAWQNRSEFRAIFLFRGEARQCGQKPAPKYF